MWEYIGYTMLILWLCRLAWLVWDCDMEDE